jgi:hypothetical protein
MELASSVEQFWFGGEMFDKKGGPTTLEGTTLWTYGELGLQVRLLLSLSLSFCVFVC